jgi:hypothetical protein
VALDRTYLLDVSAVLAGSRAQLQLLESWAIRALTRSADRYAETTDIAAEGGLHIVAKLRDCFHSE